MSDLYRQIPSVDVVATGLPAELRGLPHSLVTAEIRAVLEDVRQQIRRGEPVDVAAIPAQVQQRLRALLVPSLRGVINATGVILHTNLGRAPLPRFDPLWRYSNLEYDLDTGKRGKRDAHTAPLLERLLGAPGIAVNNNAAAVFLVLNELAAGHEVIVSRGELVEIGDGFRIPDIMERSGATLREVGTTNRTRIEDYRAAITDRTRLILRVHPSNFRITGFTSKPTVAELSVLGRERGIPLYEDLGSGCLAAVRALGFEEPAVEDSLRDGADLLSFSTDKLLGGPQAGLIVGRADLIQRIRRNPLFRALRLDKLIIQALEATLRHVLLEQWDDIPALHAIRLPSESIRSRAERLLARWAYSQARVAPGQSVIGGGSTPEQPLPTWLLTVEGEQVTAWERQLREGEPAVIARLERDRLLFDLRTVTEEEEELLLEALQRLSDRETRAAAPG